MYVCTVCMYVLIVLHSSQVRYQRLHFNKCSSLSSPRFFRRTLSVIVLIGVGRIRSERAGGLRDADDADRHGHRGSVVARRGVGRVQTPILPCYRKRSHRGTRSYHASFWMYVCMCISLYDRFFVFMYLCMYICIYLYKA